MTRDEREFEPIERHLRSIAHPSASDELRRRLRASLLSAPVVFERRPSRWALLLRPALAAVLGLALLGGGTGYAAASSLPGDPAFAVKEAFEQVELAFSIGDEARLATLQRQSARRLHELEFAAKSRPAAAQAAARAYEAAMLRLGTQLGENGDAGETNGRALEVLEELRERLPSEALPGIQRAIEAHEAIHGRFGDAPRGRPTRSAAPTPSPAPSAPSVDPLLPIPSLPLPSLRIGADAAPSGRGR